MSAISLDLGASALRRLHRSPSGEVRVVPDLARGSLRTPAGTLDGAASVSALARAALEEAARAFDLGSEPAGAPGSGRVAAVVSAATPDAERERIRADGLAAGFAAVEVLPAPIALALAAGEPGSGAWAVLDAGHGALRVHLVRWHALGARALPRLERSLVDDPELGGLALDRVLARAAWVPAAVLAGAGEPAGGAAVALPAPEELSARGFSEVKELGRHVRGPLGRPVALADGPAAVEVPSSVVRAALAGFGAVARARVGAIARVVEEAGVSRVVAGGGLLELHELRDALRAALGAKLVVLEAPVFAAARGALHALGSSPVPRVPGALSVLARTPLGVRALPLVPEGALLPARFGPLTLEVAASGAEASLEVAFVEGEPARPSGFLAAALPRRPLRSVLTLEVEWTWESGWRLLAKDVPAAALVPAAAARAAQLREALALDVSVHVEAAPVDLAFVFVATKGEGPLLARAAEAIVALARRAAGKAGGVRFAAVAVGDHPQGGVKPRYVTLVHPPGELAAFEKFVQDQVKDPVEGVDAPEAIECGILRAAELPWRPEAEKATWVLTDVPPHEKSEPPYCAVDWRESARKLRQAGVSILPVLLEGSALAPDVARRTRAFLDGLKGEGEAVLGVKGKPTEGFLSSVDRFLGKQRLGGAAREAMGRLHLALPEAPADPSRKA